MQKRRESCRGDGEASKIDDHPGLITAAPESTTRTLYHELAGALQSLLRRARGVNRRPVDGAERIPLLGQGNGFVGVRCVGMSGPDPREPGREVGREEQTTERDVAPSRRVTQRVAFLRAGEYGIDDGGVTGSDDASGFFGKYGVNARCAFRRIGLRRQTLAFAAPRQRLAFDIGA